MLGKNKTQQINNGKKTDKNQNKNGQ